MKKLKFWVVEREVGRGGVVVMVILGMEGGMGSGCEV